MLDALPCHVGDVQQTIDAACVNERTVVGEVLDDTLDLLAFLQGFQQSFALGAVPGFQHAAAGNDNVVALLVELDDLERALCLPWVVSRTGRTSTSEPGRNARMPLTSTVKPPLTLPLMTPLTTSSAAKAASRTIQIPRAWLFSRQLGFAKAIFNRVQSNVDLVTHLDGQLALLVVELLDR